MRGNALGSVAIRAVPMAWPAKRTAVATAMMVLKYILMDIAAEQLQRLVFRCKLLEADVL